MHALHAFAHQKDSKSAVARRACHCHAVDTVAEYGVRREDSRCELSSWLVPDGCLLPVPFPVAVELGRWERQSQNLTANAESQQTFEGELGSGPDCVPMPGWPRAALQSHRWLHLRS